MGGESDKDDLFIAPTLITDVKNNDAIMEDEVSDTSFTCGIVLTYYSTTQMQCCTLASKSIASAEIITD